jgi:hypothetical protein
MFILCFYVWAILSGCLGLSWLNSIDLHILLSLFKYAKRNRPQERCDPINGLGSLIPYTHLQVFGGFSRRPGSFAGCAVWFGILLMSINGDKRDNNRFEKFLTSLSSLLIG